jgi:Flp pilus assembly pilin Flp
MAEYGVVLAVITLAVIAAITLLSERVRGAITSVANIMPGG